MEEEGQRLKAGIMSGKDTAALVRIKRIEEQVLVIKGLFSIHIKRQINSQSTQFT